MSVKLLTEKHLEFLRVKRGCTGSSESTLVKMPHCWESHVAAHKCFTVLHVSHQSDFQQHAMIISIGSKISEAVRITAA